jgi:hypothetical protein
MIFMKSSSLKPERCPLSGKERLAEFVISTGRLGKGGEYAEVQLDGVALYPEFVTRLNLGHIGDVARDAWGLSSGLPIRRFYNR